MVFLSTFMKGSMCNRLEILKWVLCHRGSETHSSKVIADTLGGSKLPSERAMLPPACVDFSSVSRLQPLDTTDKDSSDPRNTGRSPSSPSNSPEFSSDPLYSVG